VTSMSYGSTGTGEHMGTVPQSTSVRAGTAMKGKGSAVALELTLAGGMVHQVPRPAPALQLSPPVVNFAGAVCACLVRRPNSQRARWP
jgi:hypothetical protein